MNDARHAKGKERLSSVRNICINLGKKDDTERYIEYVQPRDYSCGWFEKISLFLFHSLFFRVSYSFFSRACDLFCFMDKTAASIYPPFFSHWVCHGRRCFSN